MIETWFMRRIEADEETVATFERQLEERTPLDKAAYAGLIGRGPGRVHSDSAGWFDLAAHGSGG